MRHKPEGVTALSGKLDQVAMHGVLMRIRDMGINLIYINFFREENRHKPKGNKR
jgi:hypothetical protein